MSSLLFNSDTWRVPLPAPFNSVTKKVSGDVGSQYNAGTVKSTLHSATLSAILAYMELEYTSSYRKEMPKGAIGIRDNEESIVEYASHSGELHLVSYSRKTGMFTAGRFSGTVGPMPYSIENGNQSGVALFFALLPFAVQDSEFSKGYEKLLSCRENGYIDINLVINSAFMLCDNLYRRIESAKMLKNAGLPVNIQMTGNISAFSQLRLDNGDYSPSTVLFGEFEHLKSASGMKAPSILKGQELKGKYTFNTRILTSKEKQMVPTLESWYVVPDEVQIVSQMAKETTKTGISMRNFLLRGPSGCGKTEAAKAVAAAINLPYCHVTCHTNMEVADLLGMILPEMDSGDRTTDLKCIPTFEQIEMDPVTAYKEMVGKTVASVTSEEVYEKLLQSMTQKQASKNNKDSGIRYNFVNSPLVQALRYGWVCEIQEISVIANPGVLVGLNSMLDQCKSVVLPTGERIERHPDAVLIATTNTEYSRCRSINQSVISRMNLIFDLEEPDIATLIKRVSGITKCKDIKALRSMSNIVRSIAKYCKQNGIVDGCCGTRELIAWVQAYMIMGDMLETAKYTILSSVSANPDYQKSVLDSCVAPMIGKAA